MILAQTHGDTPAARAERRLMTAVEITPVQYALSFSSYTCTAYCLYFGPGNGTNAHRLEFIADTRKEVEALRRDFIALLKKHRFKQIRKV